MPRPLIILFLNIHTSEGAISYQEKISNAIENSIQASKKREKVRFKKSRVFDFQDLIDAIKEYNPDILHLSAGSCSDTGLIMLDKQEEQQLIDVHDLSHFLKENIRSPELVLFDVQKSANLARMAAQNGFASIGMDGELEVEQGQKFWSGFYTSIGNAGRLNIGEALTAGRSYMWFNSTDVPCLYRDPLLTYYEQLIGQINHRLNEICLIPHTLTHSLVEHPEVVKSPLEGLTINTEFANLEEAFVQNKQRLLVLGEAGSGKTVSLMKFAREKANEWFHDKEHVELFPLWLQLADWKPEARLLTWIQQQSELDDVRFRQMWEAKQFLLIFDSLDELPTDIPVKDSTTLKRLNYQQAFVHAWEEDPYLAEIPCILTSRISDYEILTQKYKKNLISLHGAVTLEPLRESIIREYLKNAHIDGGNTLTQVLLEDSKLLDLVRLPIFLEIVCNAYQDQAFVQNAANNDQDLRLQVINSYLEKNYLSVQSRSVSLEDLTSVMGKAIFELMSDFHSEDSLLPLKLIVDQLPDPKQLPAYLHLVREMNLIEPYREDMYRFRHLLIRDYLVNPFALQALKAQIAPQRVQGIVILGKLGNIHVVDELSLLRDDPDEGVRYELAYTLGRIRTPQAKLILMQYLLDDKPDIRMAAVRSLSLYGDADLLGTLIRLIKNPTEDRFVRAEAIEAAMELAKHVPTERSGELETLRKELNLLTNRDKIYEIREAAKEALEVIGLPANLPPSQFLIDQLRSQDYQKHPDELSQLWVMAVHMLTSFGFDYEEISHRPYLPISSAEIGDLLIDSLIMALEHPHAPIARQLAAKSLGRLGVEKAVDSLNELMRKDEFSFVRVEALSALKYIYLYPTVSIPTRVKIHQYLSAANLANEISEMKFTYTVETDSLQENIDIFQDISQNDYERFRAALKIADLARAVDTRSAIDILMQALLDPDHPDVAAAAAIALGQMGNANEAQQDQVIRLLIQNINNEDHVVRAQVCITLAKMVTKDLSELDIIVENLLTLWRNDPISDVRNRAERGILEIYKRTKNHKARQALSRLGKLPR